MLHCEGRSNLARRETRVFQASRLGLGGAEAHDAIRSVIRQRGRNVSLAWKHPVLRPGTLETTPYSLNPHLPKVRAKAVFLVRSRGFGVRRTARYFGVHPGTVSKWLAKVPVGTGMDAIPTGSSRPRTSPNAIPRETVDRIVALRRQHGRCAQVLHAQLSRAGVAVSLSTVQRTLARQGLLRKRGPRKLFLRSGERPAADHPGDLVQADSIHLMRTERERTFVLTIIDCFSRWAYAWALESLSAPGAVAVVRRARAQAPFAFRCVQSDHGPEFGSCYTQRLGTWGIRHRHTRVRQPNDNAHVERFNRTLREDLRRELADYVADVPKLNTALSEWIHYYNAERPHLGLGGLAPLEVFPSS